MGISAEHCCGCHASSQCRPSLSCSAKPKAQSPKPKAQSPKPGRLRCLLVVSLIRRRPNAVLQSACFRCIRSGDTRNTPCCVGYRMSCRVHDARCGHRRSSRSLRLVQTRSPRAPLARYGRPAVWRCRFMLIHQLIADESRVLQVIGQSV